MKKKKSKNKYDSEALFEELESYVKRILSYTPNTKTSFEKDLFPDLWPEKTTNIPVLDIPKYARLYSSLLTNSIQNNDKEKEIN